MCPAAFLTLEGEYPFVATDNTSMQSQAQLRTLTALVSE
jgi:hypothetical protein